MTRRPAGRARQADVSASGERMGLDLAAPLTAPPMAPLACSKHAGHAASLRLLWWSRSQTARLKQLAVLSPSFPIPPQGLVPEIIREALHRSQPST